MLTQARKVGNHVHMAILQVILGEAATVKGRVGKDLTDEQVENIIRGMFDRNKETLALIAGKRDETALQQENVFLASLLPQTLTVEEIMATLAEITPEIKAAPKEGAAVGVAMKFLKPKGVKALGDDVKVAVQRMRTA